MKKISLVNFIGALIILLTAWVPPTRIFLTDVDFGTPIVGILSLLLCISTVGSYKKYKQKIDVFSFIISLSPLIFIVVRFIIALSGAPLAP